MYISFFKKNNEKYDFTREFMRVFLFHSSTTEDLSKKNFKSVLVTETETLEKKRPIRIYRLCRLLSGAGGAVVE